ncbi:MarR family transcriptional regulator [Nocardia sp. NPDC088792]|uniref:MarR family transcriptional regulator n=1 Tax=Nocardia sp. NPDC088792 TaxID=3364332 RepID=UPI003824DEF9
MGLHLRLLASRPHRRRLPPLEVRARRSRKRRSRSRLAPPIRAGRSRAFSPPIREGGSRRAPLRSVGGRREGPRPAPPGTGPLTVGELARRAGLAADTSTYVLDRLVQKGFVRRSKRSGGRSQSSGRGR